MKYPLRKRQKGRAFTLVELLVVMGIIAILVGTIGISVGSALRFAKRTRSTSIATSIQTAVQNYYTEYSVYPTRSVDTAGTDSYYDGSAGSGGWKDLIYALCGNVNPSNPGVSPGTISVSNTRAISFFSPSKSDLDSASGVPQNPFFTAGSAVIPQFYYMIIDTDYSGVAGDSGGYTTKIPAFGPNTNVFANPAAPIAAGVGVWSPNDQPTSGVSPAAFWSHTY